MVLRDNPSTPPISVPKTVGVIRVTQNVSTVGHEGISSYSRRRPRPRMST